MITNKKVKAKTQDQKQFEKYAKPFFYQDNIVFMRDNVEGYYLNKQISFAFNCRLESKRLQKIQAQG